MDESTAMDRVTVNIKEILQSLQWTQDDLAHEMQMDPSNLSKKLRQKNNARLDTIERIAEALKVDIYELFRVPAMAKSNAMTIFRNNTEAHLIARGWTVQHLADVIGMDRSYLSKVIRGIHSPNLALLEKIAKACEIEVFELLQPLQLVS